MEKAYDLGELAKKMQEAGLPIALEAGEAAAGKMYGVFKEWLKESAVLSTNKIDDVVMPFVDQIDSVVLPQIDKIDGQVG